ncbi:CRTAC1 family protein [Tautonia sociabilis]|uniref:Thioredoxin n=1 Tax=Tautonia sociabilis TaxID=2080755 RepID=A0A432MFX0_9BACT|nr:CRTAC1 family protein [Tautonia sociabilis]RUL85376.1 thioredoxin [Tautonia sociabilis]
MRGRRRRLALAAVALALVAGALAGLDALRVRGELRAARAELAQGRVATARDRLAGLSAKRPGAVGGAVDYWLGICESIRGRPDAALDAFGRVPVGFPFDPVGAFHEASANLRRGRLRPAEDRLERLLRRGSGGLDEARDLLRRLYVIQVRIDDAMDLMRSSLGTSRDPLRLLKELADLGRGSLPLDGLAQTLEQAGRMAPEDDRVWLGRARLAMLQGRWEEADHWLLRCEQADADPPIWRARLDWALGAGRPEAAAAAIRRLGPDRLDRAEILELRSWFAERAGDEEAERRSLERLLQVDPASTRALECLAAIAGSAGEEEAAAGYRERKAVLDRNLERYRWRLQDPNALRAPDQAMEMARLADAIGLREEALAWCDLALASAPRLPAALELRARLDRPASPEPDDGGESWGRLLELADRVPPTRDEEPSSPVRFEDDADRAGLSFTYENGETPYRRLPEPLGGGVALLDFDGDGLLDVFAVQGGAFPPEPGSPCRDRLFRNRGDGTFEDVSESSGISEFAGGYGLGVTVGDIDNDGHPDLFLTRWRSYALYRNRGDGTFEDATEAAGLGGDRDWPTSAAFADLDDDGDLDLYVCHYAAWDERRPRLCRDEATGVYISCNPLEFAARPDHLFRNDGGRFEDVSPSAGIVDRDGRGLGVVAADLDDDGRVDLYVANDMTANVLWRNLGGMRFEDVAEEAGVAGDAGGGFQAGMGVAAGDLDGDGRIDLAVTNFFGESTTYYRNLGGGLFHDSTNRIGLEAVSRSLLGFGLVMFDANNDGLLDLASANGHVSDYRPNFPYTMPTQLLLGGPGGRLVDVTHRAGPPWAVPRIGRGLAAGDLDNDGRIDLLLLSHNQPIAYLHNQTQGGHFVGFRLEGRDSNRDAVGTRVVVRAGGRSWVAERVGGGSYQSASDPRIHLGIGKATVIDEVEVFWPSGHEDRLRNLPVDSWYLIREGAAGADRIGRDRPPDS